MHDFTLKQACIISTATILDCFLENVCAHLCGMSHECEIETLDTSHFLQEGEVIAYAKGLIVNRHNIGYYWITHEPEQSDTHDIIFSKTEFKDGLYDPSSSSVKPVIPAAIDYVRVYEKPENLSHCKRESIHDFLNAFPENQGIRLNKEFAAFTQMQNIVRATSDTILNNTGINTVLYIP